MPSRNPKLVIIGGGIAGLCTAVYARRCGYQVDVFERHDSAGGLATSWRRGDYVFENCLHWLLGSNPTGAMHARWLEVFDIDRLKFVYAEEFLRVEGLRGDCLSVYADIDRTESEFLRVAPQDAPEIRRLTAAVRRLASCPIPDASEPWLRRWLTLLRALPYLGLLRRYSRVSSAELGGRFTHPLLRAFFEGNDDASGMAAMALVCSLAWISGRNAGYPIGGSQAVIGLIVENLRRLGGNLHLGADVARIVVDHGVAVGVRLGDGESVAADWVISAADGHATLHELLGGRYHDAATDRNYGTLRTFPSYVQVCLGVARDLSRQPGYATMILGDRLDVDPGTRLSQVAVRCFHFDPTFSPPGKTAVTCFLPTRNYRYWVELAQGDAARYQAEKRRVAQAVVAILERGMPDIRPCIEVIDVTTPASVIRYTGNWQGSMEGWLPTPGSGFRPLPQSLSRLARFLMVGQWVMPGGGLPAGLMSARAAVRSMCRQDRMPFLPA